MWRIDCALMVSWLPVGVQAQSRGAPPPAQAQAQTQTPQDQPATDALGRDTPQGTVMGFLDAARRGELAIAQSVSRRSGHVAEYGGPDPAVVRRPRCAAAGAARRQISEAPEGSRSNPLRPDQEVVGTIGSAAGDIDVVLERVDAREQRADLAVLADDSRGGSRRCTRK